MKDLLTSLQVFIVFAGSSIVKRGKYIVQNLDTTDYDLSDEKKLIISIPSSNGYAIYEVELEYDTATKKIYGKCTCPFTTGTCKHQVAAALQWTTLLHTGQTKQQAAPVIPSKKESSIRPEPASIDFPNRRIAYDLLQKFAPGFRMNEGQGMMWHYKTRYTELNEGKKWQGNFMEKFEASAAYKDNNHLTITCNCKHLKEHELCQHAVAILLFISTRISPFYFFRFNDYSREKTALLQQYGISPEDALAKEFEFGINEYTGAFQITKKPDYILGPAGLTDWNKLNNMLQKPKKTIIINTDQIKDNYESALLLNFSNTKKGGFALEPVMMWKKNDERSFKRMPFENDQHLSYLNNMPEQMVKALQKITGNAIIEHLVSNGFPYLNKVTDPFKQLGEKELELVQNLIYETVLAIKPFVTVYKHIFQLPAGQKFANANLKPASLSGFTPVLQFRLQRKNEFLQLECLVVLNNTPCPLHDFELMHYFLRYRNEYFLLNKEDLPTLKIFAAGKLIVHEKEKNTFIENVVKPLAQKYDVDCSGILQTCTIEALPEAKVYLSELNENFLLITPRWQYEHIEVEDDESETVVEQDGILYKILRNKEEEKKLTETIRSFNNKFTWQNNGYFYLSFKEALQNNWFLDFYNALQQKEIPVYGINELKKFRYNANKPSISIRSGNGIDWFDITIEVSYGDLIVPMQELRKAIISNQEYILLSDGSMGALPQEWIEQYALLMHMAQVKDGQLRLSKFNWTIIDGLHQQLNDAALHAQIAEKKLKLEQINKASATAYTLPANITATLRNYQQAGFQWLCLLDEMGWGGCLADDMGLGKTLQAISFLQHATEKFSGEQHIVVCPTSLIYNWEAELQKFAPKLAYYIHYANDRDFTAVAMKKADIIITSYGLLRSDIEQFTKMQFGYVVLDESHAIKNPASQIAKAVQLLKARNRIALSGTPLQNNTFDLYAQMQFLNPGMLGSQEFFKKEFAGPIDKNGDIAKTEQLKRIIYPFMLRRTKEQVAKDLPDKTEMILWCEMENEQRKIYNSFKEHYRQNIMEKIAAEGIGKSSFFILEGLTKLRQICDSPAILNEKEKYPGQSAKLDELVRELEENTGNHKALVFSQFTSMLALVRESLEEHGINYCYLDGSTPAGDRKKLVRQFQEDDNLRVFLISLKAGGVGLNLTAADYVYLIDPWWNPAAEQQAIDRTHRIGQQKKVFAYKMICKDTVEEKILQLQQKKKKLSADLISDETGFVKKLTKDDVAWLFG